MTITDLIEALIQQELDRGGQAIVHVVNPYTGSSIEVDRLEGNDLYLKEVKG